MSFWQIFGESAVSDQGETIQRLGLTFGLPIHSAECNKFESAVT